MSEERVQRRLAAILAADVVGYDRELEDIFAAQDEVARQVADALSVTILPDEGDRLSHVPTNNIEAYDLYMRSRLSAWPPTLSNILTALRLDPQYMRGPYLNALGRACFMAGRYEEAIEAYERNKSNGGPIAVPMLSVWTACLGILGRTSEAQESARELIRYAPGYTISHAHKTFKFRSSDDLNRLIEGLRKAGLPEN